MNYTWVYFMLLGLWLAPIAFAQSFTPLHPLTPHSDHRQQNHSGHDHANEDLTGINVGGANSYSSTLRDANLSGVNLTDANLSGDSPRPSNYDNAVLTTLYGNRAQGRSTEVKRHAVPPVLPIRLLAPRPLFPLPAH